MTEYKKEEPKPYPDWEQLHTPPIPMTIEHYLANVIWSACQLLDYDSYGQKVGEAIIHDTRKAWDLIDE